MAHEYLNYMDPSDVEELIDGMYDDEAVKLFGSEEIMVEYLIANFLHHYGQLTYMKPLSFFTEEPVFWFDPEKPSRLTRK